MAYVALVHGACENGHTSDAEEFFEAAAGRLLNPKPWLSSGSELAEFGDLGIARHNPWHEAEVLAVYDSDCCWRPPESSWLWAWAL